MKLNKIYNLMERIDNTFRDFMLLNENLILEAASLADVYQKYYSNIPEDEFRQIVAADPTSGDDKMGKYAKWLLALYIGGNLKLEDLYKATQYLTTFHKYKGKLEKKDIGQYKSLSELYDAIEQYSDNTQAASHKEELRQIKKGAKKVYEDDEWLIIIPETQEAAIEYGKGTQWCTAATSSSNMFNNYNSQGPLYININKDTGEKFQFHFESNQFMDETDSPVSGYEVGLSDGALEFYKKTNPRGYLSLLGGGDPDETLNYVEDFLAEGTDPEEVFIDIDNLEGSDEYRIGVFSERQVDYGETSQLCVLLNKDNEIVSGAFINEGESEGFLKMRDSYGQEYNFLNLKTLDYLFDWGQEISYADDFNNGIAHVEGDWGRTENYVRTDGTFVSEKWYSSMDIVSYDEKDSPFIVGLDRDNVNLMDCNGNLMFKEWFKSIESRGFDGYLRVTNHDGKKNWLAEAGDGKYEFLLNDWFDDIGIPKNGSCIVLSGGKTNLYNLYTNEFVFNNFYLDKLWYMGFDEINSNLMLVCIDKKYNIADISSGSPRPVCKNWFDNILFGFKENGIAAIEINGKCNFIDLQGNYLSKTWYDKIEEPYFMKGFYMVSIGDKCNFLTQDLKLCFNPWLDNIFRILTWDSEKLQNVANNQNLWFVKFKQDGEQYVIDLSSGFVEPANEYLEKNNINLDRYYM